MPVINKLLGAMLGMVVGLALTPVVVDTVNALITAHTGTFGSGAEALVELLPLFYVIIVIAGAIAYIKIGK